MASIVAVKSCILIAIESEDYNYVMVGLTSPHTLDIARLLTALLCSLPTSAPPQAQAAGARGPGAARHGVL